MKSRCPSLASQQLGVTNQGRHFFTQGTYELIDMAPMLVRIRIRVLRHTRAPVLPCAQLIDDLSQMVIVWRPLEKVFTPFEGLREYRSLLFVHPFPPENVGSTRLAAGIVHAFLGTFFERQLRYASVIK
jgi:hypothetical protein